MAKKSKPRSGSLAFYPRKRAKSIVAKFKSFKDVNEFKVLNFFGYKAGMAHIMAVNKHKKSPLENQKISIPVTIIETPPITVFGIRFYKKADIGLKVMKEFVFKDKASEEVSKRIKGFNRGKVKGDLLKKANDFYEKNKDAIVDIRLIAHTNPKLTTIGKKKPEVVEIFMSGSNDDKINYFKEKLGNNIEINEVFKENSFLDVKSVTKGHGFEGVIKRFGVKRRSHKAEKGVRRVGSISPWHPPLIMWTVPMPGQHGYHTRTVYNLKLMKIASSDELNKASGWKHYGLIKNNAILLAGSVPGPVKRTIALRDAIRPVKDIKYDAEVEKLVLINKS